MVVEITLHVYAEEYKRKLGLVETQRSFQHQVEAAGHRYALVRGLDDLEKALEG